MSVNNCEIANIRADIERAIAELNNNRLEYVQPEFEEALKALYHVNALLQALAVASSCE